MVTKHSEASLKRLHTLEEYDIEPTWHEANGLIDYNYYFLRARHARARELSRMMRLAGTAIKLHFDRMCALVHMKPRVKTTPQIT